MFNTKRTSLKRGVIKDRFQLSKLFTIYRNIIFTMMAPTKSDVLNSLSLKNLSLNVFFSSGLLSKKIPPIFNLFLPMQYNSSPLVDYLHLLDPG